MQKSASIQPRTSPRKFGGGEVRLPSLVKVCTSCRRLQAPWLHLGPPRGVVLNGKAGSIFHAISSEVLLDTSGARPLISRGHISFKRLRPGVYEVPGPPEAAQGSAVLCLAGLPRDIWRANLALRCGRTVFLRNGAVFCGPRPALSNETLVQSGRR